MNSSASTPRGPWKAASVPSGVRIVPPFWMSRFSNIHALICPAVPHWSISPLPSRSFVSRRA